MALSAVPDLARRAGLYVRVSAVMGRTGEDFLSPSIQADTMRGAAARLGHEVAQVWEDIDVSGRSMARPALTEAMAAAREGRIDVLWVYDLSRFARNAAGGLAELAAIEKCGVEVLSATETLDRKTSSGRLTAGVLLLLAEHYSDLVGERWRGVIAANAERGVLHGRAPVGYVRTERRTVEADPVLGPAMSEAFRRVATGESIQLLAREMSRLSGRSIYPRTVQQALQNPTYLGLVRHNGQTYEGRHPALTDPETWERVQIRLRSYAETPPRSREARYALAGLVKCERCGKGLWRRIASPKNPVDHLVCRSARYDGLSGCRGIGTPSYSEVEAKVLEQIRLRLVDVEDVTAAEAVRLSQHARSHADLRAVLDELGRVERSLGALAVKLGEGVLSDLAYRAAAKQLEAKAGLLREQRQHVEASVADALTFEQSRDLASALLETWPDLTPKERNAALRTHVVRVTVRRSTYYREPATDRVTVALR